MSGAACPRRAAPPSSGKRVLRAAGQQCRGQLAVRAVNVPEQPLLQVAQDQARTDVLAFQSEAGNIRQQSLVRIAMLRGFRVPGVDHQAFLGREMMGGVADELPERQPGVAAIVQRDANSFSSAASRACCVSISGTPTSCATLHTIAGGLSIGRHVLRGPGALPAPLVLRRVQRRVGGNQQALDRDAMLWETRRPRPWR